jgi:hypothetical protein
VLKGDLCTSGIYELTPVGLSSRSAYVKLTAEIEEALSPLRRLAQIRATLVIGYGNLETPEFQRQAVDFAAALEQAGKKVSSWWQAGTTISRFSRHWPVLMACWVVLRWRRCSWALFETAASVLDCLRANF